MNKQNLQSEAVYLKPKSFLECETIQDVHANFMALTRNIRFYSFERLELLYSLKRKSSNWKNFQLRLDSVLINFPHYYTK